MPTENNLYSCVNLAPASCCFHGKFSVAALALAWDDNILIVNVANKDLIGSIISLTRGICHQRVHIRALMEKICDSEIWNGAKFFPDASCEGD